MGSLAEAALTTLAVSLCCLPPGRADINHSSGFNSAVQARRSAHRRTVSRRRGLFYRSISKQRGSTGRKSPTAAVRPQETKWEC